MKNVGLAVGPPRDHLPELIACLRRGRIPRLTLGIFAGGEVPVLREDLLQLQDHRAFEPQLRISPEAEARVAAGVSATAMPSSRESHRAVDDHDLAVIAQVDRPALAEARSGQSAGNEDPRVAHGP